MMPSSTCKRPVRKAFRGITLPELLIVMVIVGILGSLAYPQYREFAARAKRTEAVAALLRIQVNQERFYLSNNTFTNDLTKLGFSSSSDAKTNSGSYSVNITAADAGNYTAVATYLNTDGEKDKCKTFTIQDGDVKTSAPDTNCWTRTR